MTQAPRADYEVRLVIDERLEHGGDLRRVVLAVRVGGHNELGTQFDAERIAHAEGVAVAEVLRQDERDGAGVERHLVGVIIPSIDDDECRDT